MAIAIVQLGTKRQNKKELRLGTVRRPPRGVRKEDYGRLNYYDVWLPILSPTPDLKKFWLEARDEKTWKQFAKKFRAEMKEPAAAHTLELLAALSHKTDFSIGCYCEDENHCHRRILKELLENLGAEVE